MEAEFRAVAAAVSNWGRWGPDDELGTLNFITPESTVRAVALARQGKVFSLCTTIDARTASSSPIRPSPVHLMSVLDGRIDQAWAGAVFEEHGPMRFNDDILMMPLQATTQWDGLAHISYEGMLYNGRPSTSVTTSGAEHLGIENAARRAPIVGRGVLLDLARRAGSDCLPDHYRVGPSELEDAVADAGLKVGPGDVVLVRTGWLRANREGMSTAATAPGLDWRCATWLATHELAAVAADNPAVENRSTAQEPWALPLHMLAIRDMGMMLGELWNLDDLAEDCARDGVYEFLLVAPPLAVARAVGSPLNPIAIK